MMHCEIQSCVYSNYILTLCSVVHSLRFDLIFLMLDPQDEFYDRRLATHLVSLYHQTQEEEEEEFLVNKTRFFFLLLCGCVVQHLGYRKIPKISPGAYIFQRPFLKGLNLKGLIFGGAFLRKEVCVLNRLG